MPCSHCHITQRLSSNFWSFWAVAAERLGGIIVATVIAGSLASAFYFTKEYRRMEEQLNEIAEEHQEAELENERMRRRALHLMKEHTRMCKQAQKMQVTTSRTEAMVEKLKRQDSVGKAEVAALHGDLMLLQDNLEQAVVERDAYRERLRACLSCCASRPVTY